jgi:hypothetical protein
MNFSLTMLDWQHEGNGQLMKLNKMVQGMLLVARMAGTKRKYSNQYKTIAK